VTVSVKGTKNVTITDKDGRFSINVPDRKAILTFSYVGYVLQEVSIGNKTRVDIVMNEDTQSLGEIVVTAFGIERQKRSIGYAQQKIDGDALTLAREPNVLNSLKGRAAGVFINQSSGGPAGSSYISIRGNSSLAGNNQPLFVV